MAKARRKNVFKMVENCNTCDSKMLESDKLMIHSNKLSELCKPCREINYDNKLWNKRIRRQAVIDHFNKSKYGKVRK